MTSHSSLLVAVLVGAAGCMVGPDYRRPEVVTPPSWGELAPAAPPAGPVAPPVGPVARPAGPVVRHRKRR